MVADRVSLFLVDEDGQTRRKHDEQELGFFGTAAGELDLHAPFLARLDAPVADPTQTPTAPAESPCLGEQGAAESMRTAVAQHEPAARRSGRG